MATYVQHGLETQSYVTWEACIQLLSPLMECEDLFCPAWGLVEPPPVHQIPPPPTRSGAGQSWEWRGPPSVDAKWSFHKDKCHSQKELMINSKSCLWERLSAPAHKVITWKVESPVAELCCRLASVNAKWTLWETQPLIVKTVKLVGKPVLHLTEILVLYF